MPASSQWAAAQTSPDARMAGLGVAPAVTLQQTFFSSITFATTTLQAYLDVVTTTSSLLGRTVQPPQGQGRGESGLQSSVFRAGRSLMCDG